MLPNRIRACPSASRLSSRRVRRSRAGIAETTVAAESRLAAVADQKEVREIAEVRLAIDHDSELTLLFDPGHSLDERIVSEQFVA